MTSTRAKRVGNATPRREFVEDAADAWYELILPSASVPASRGQTDGDEDPSSSSSSLSLAAAMPTTPRLRVSQVKGQGELGTVVWNAALVLCSTLTDDVVRGRRVLEIGAGCGACGFYAAALGAAETTIADCGPKTMSNLRRTLREYARLCRTTSSDDEDDDDAITDKHETKREEHQDLPWDTDTIHLRRHLWEEDSEILEARLTGTDPRRVRHWSNAGGTETADGSPAPGFAPTLAPDAIFDVIIGSDLLYFSSQESSLLAALRLRLRPQTGVCVLVQTLRGNNAEVFSRFITDARRYFRVDVVSVPLPGGFNAAKETPHTVSVDPYRLVTLHPL